MPSYNGCNWCGREWWQYDSHIKKFERHEYLADIFNSDDLTIEILNADYENIGSLRNLDITNTVRCGKYVKNCVTKYF